MGRDCSLTAQKVSTHTRKNTSRLSCWHRLCLPWNKFSAAWKRLYDDAVKEKVNLTEQIISDWRTSCFCYIPLLGGEASIPALCARGEPHPLELFHVAEATLRELGLSSLPSVPQPEETEGQTFQRGWKKLAVTTSWSHLQIYKSPFACTQLSHHRLSTVLWNPTVPVQHASLSPPDP